MNDEDVIREFLIESNENLSRLDNEIVELERRPKDAHLLASIFRTMHTLKGTCGFLAFGKLERIAHEAETIFSQLRAGDRELNPELTSLVLEVIDATRAILQAIEATGGEGDNDCGNLIERLKRAAKATPQAFEPAPKAPAAEVLPAMVAQTPELEAAAQAQPRGDPARNEETEHRSAAADSAIRVDVGLLDKLMNLVGELVLARNQILQFSARNDGGAWNATSQRLNLITTELQEGVMKTRMQPIGVVWNKLPRVVRDLAHSLGKQIRLETDGASTELDKTIIEAIKDPLTHLVRNCCDHGIERPDVRILSGKPPQGRILLRAYHEGGQVNIEITDDGAGVDLARVKQKAVERGLLREDQLGRMSEREILNLIFRPGFSTAERVTNVSGRGVGMDVVRSNIEKIGGVVDLSNRFGEGSTVRVKIPLTLAIIPGLVVTSGTARFVIPQVSLLELVRLEGEAGKQIEWIHGTPVLRRRGTLLPIAYLNRVLELGGSTAGEVLNIVVLQAEDRQFGLVVDGISDTQEIVVKPLAKQLKGLAVYAGATIMGDGKVALILDAVGVGQRSGVLSSTGHSRADAAVAGHAASDIERLVLFRAGAFERLVVPLSLVARLEEFDQAKIERSGGGRVVQYRGRILPLVVSISVLDPAASDAVLERDPLQVIVFTEGERSIGLVVDQIVDIVEGNIAVRRQGTRRGLLGSAVVAGQVTDFLDLHAVLQAVAPDWFDPRREGGRWEPAPTVLLAEASPLSRGLLRTGLEMAGYRVLEAASTPAALQVLAQHAADLLMASENLPPAGSAELIEAVRNQSREHRLPAICLTTSGAPPENGVFEEYQRKFDWPGMLRSLERLSAAAAGPPASERKKVPDKAEVKP
ncbi:MAG: chemotaxis protein CheW [Bryobacteraceae bacterium]